MMVIDSARNEAEKCCDRKIKLKKIRENEKKINGRREWNILLLDNAIISFSAQNKYFQFYYCAIEFIKALRSVPSNENLKQREKSEEYYVNSQWRHSSQN